jgi:hypothetical protein
MKKIQAMLAAAVFASTTSANASILLANDSFSITSISKANAASVKNDAGGDGWAGGWQTQMTAATAPQLVAVKNMEGGTALEFSKNADQAAFRLLETPISGDVLVDFLIQVNGTPKANTSLGLKTDCGGVAKCTDDLFARTTGQAGPFVSGSNLTSGKTYHLFAHLYKSKANGYFDSLDAWLNPTAEEVRTLTHADLHTAGASKIASFDTIGFRTVNLATGVSVRVDALNISTVPEPGSLALMGLAAAGMGFLRRRK